MLILARLIHESLVITLPDGTHVRVTVHDIDRGKVRLAFDCPRSVPILRTELIRAKEAK